MDRRDRADEVERVLSELNDAIVEETIDDLASAPMPLSADPELNDRRRSQRRSVVPDRRLADRRQTNT